MAGGWKWNRLPASAAGYHWSFPPRGWKSRPSASRHAHMASHRRPLVLAVNDKVMPLWLAGDGGPYGLLERRVVRPRTQNAAEIGGILLAEAHVEHPGASEAHAVAAFAEIMGHRRDEADAPSGLGHGVIARRS